MENTALVHEVIAIAAMFMRLDDEQGLRAVGEVLSRVECSLTSEELLQEYRQLISAALMDIDHKDYVHLTDLLLYQLVPFINQMAEETI